MNLKTLAGNGPLKHQLDVQASRRGLSHAFILSGPAGSGKRTLAGLLAAALVCTCTQEDARPCSVCNACRKAAAGIHPDVIRVGSDGKDIAVAQIRALRSDAHIRPNEADRKVYLIENAQSMNTSAQNAMLKLLEEGPPYTAFLLLAENSAALLPTVRSRCETLALSPVSQGEALDFLNASFPDVPLEIRSAAANRCEGLLGRAVALISGVSAGDAEVRDAALVLLHALSDWDELSFLERTIAWEKWDRDKISALMGELVLLLRDALVVHAGGAPDPDPERRDAAEYAARSLSPKKLLCAADQAVRLRSACGFNVGVGHLCGWLAASFSRIVS